MKKAALALVVLIVLVVSALLILPSFWDWNGEKGRIATLVKEHSGRELKIAGDVSLRLLPTPAFSAEAVTLANIEGGSQPAMVQLEELRIRIALLPLLRGNVLVESVTLVKPEVFLEVLPDGRANWDLAAAPAGGGPGTGIARAPGDASGGGTGDERAAGDESVRVDSFIIEDGRLRYSDTRSGRDEVVSGLNAELGADSLLGPFAARGTAVYQGVPIEFDIGLDRIVEAGATGVSLTLGLPGAEASGSFTGAFSRHEDLRSLRGRLQIDGPDLAGFLQGLPGGAASSAAPALLAQPFSVSAEVTASDSEAAAKAVQLKFGPLSFDGQVTATLGELPDFAVKLSTKTIDLDRLLASQPDGAAPQDTASPAITPAPGGPPPDNASPGAAESGARLPRGFAATLDFTTDAVLYRGQTLRQLQVAARLEDGRLELKKAAAQLPGSSDLAVSGTLSEDAKGPRFSGSVTADSDNLRGLLQWLGVDPTEVPADRLRRLSLKSQVDLATGQITLRNTELQLDVSKLTGGVAVALRERPGFGIGLTVDSLNLDAYLPVPQPQPKSQPQATPEATPQTGDPAAPGAAPGAGTGMAAPTAAPPAGLPLLGAFDANIDLKIGQLTYRGLPLGGLRLDATLQRGGLIVREMSVADFAGSQASFIGSLANVDRSPSFDGSLDLSVAALSRLVKAAGLDELGQLPLESFALSGAVNGNRDELRFDQRLSALNGSLRVAGRADLRPAALSLEAVVELDHPDLSILLGELLRDASVPAGLGPVAVKGDLTASLSALRLSGLTGKLAGVDLLGGDLGLSLVAARPKFTAELTTGAMPLAALAAPAAAVKQDRKSDEKTAGTSAAGAAGKAGRERWSRKTIDLAALRAVDAEIKLRAKTLIIDHLRLDDAEVEAVLDAGLLDLKRFTARLYGGALSVNGQADARETAAGGLAVTAAVTASNIDIKQLLSDLADSDRFSGPVSLESKLATQGNSEAALVAGLAGNGKVAGTVTVAAKVEEQAGALVLGLLGKKVKEVRGVSDSTAVLFGAFAGAPAKLDGSFVIEQGVLRSDDLTLRGRNAVALTGGNVDLPNWQMESRTDLFRDEDPKQAYLTATLRGPLDKPNVGIGGQPFQRREEPASLPAAGDPGPGLQEQAPQAQTPEQQPAKPPKPEEILKEGVKSLLKGLGG